MGENMNLEHIKIGNTVWLEGINNYKNKPLKEFPIVKVGRKYFYVKVYYSTLKFSIKTFDENNDKYISNYIAYITKEEYLREVESREIWRELCDEFSSYHNSKKISLEKLRKIKLLIQEEEK